MYGKTMGSLRVYIDVQEKQPQRVWEINGNRGNMWKMARVSILNNKSPFQVYACAMGDHYFRHRDHIMDLHYNDGPRITF